MINVRVISLEHCTAAVKTLETIKAKATELQISIHSELIVVKTQEEAVKYRHIGGPSVQVNDLDIEKEARELKAFALA